MVDLRRQYENRNKVLFDFRYQSYKIEQWLSGSFEGKKRRPRIWIKKNWENNKSSAFLGILQSL